MASPVLSVLLALLLIPPSPPPATEPAHLGWALGEISAVTLAGTAWYWANTDLNDDDWELHWDVPSWRLKLTPDGARFDTNAFYINARNHPTAGVVNYQIGRANGFGVLGSTVLNVAASTFWEYFVEFKEIVSINDVIVNSSTGLAIGEPLLALGADLRQRSVAHEVLSMAVAPFDALHGHGASRRPGWRHAVLVAGRRDARFHGDATRQEVELGFDVALARDPRTGQPGAFSGWTPAGAHNRLAGTLLFGDGEPEGPVTGARVATRTTLGGYARQAIDDDGVGGSVLVAAATAFTYDTRRLPGGEHDRLALTHLGGGLLELAAYLPSATVRWETALYGDFALVDAHAFEAPPRFPGEVRTSSMVAQGYYFGWGATLDSRLRVDVDEWSASASLVAHVLRAIDGLDRVDDPETPRGMTDQRARGRLELALRPTGRVATILAGIEGTVRRGTADETPTRRTFELGGTLALALTFD